MINKNINNDNDRNMIDITNLQTNQERNLNFNINLQQCNGKLYITI
jgi:hypothetical protein